MAFSPHRIEALAPAVEHMRRHEAIVLEEPENPLFLSMLEKMISIEAYLFETDFQFPRFAERSCRLLREFHAEGKSILQIDPFMDRLQEIHERFARGDLPGAIRQGSVHHSVYWAERRCTEALLDYYLRSAGTDFDGVVASSKRFARADAARGRLRDRLRAEKLASLTGSFKSIYVEAGELHAALLPELRRRIPASTRVVPLYLMDRAVREFGGTHRGLGPGDLLTLIYVFRPAYEGERADLLAARNLIHVKILKKIEMGDEDWDFPHTRDQVESNRLVDGLTYRECGALFREIRPLATDEARELVRAHRKKQS